MTNRIDKKDRDLFTTLFLAKRPLPIKKLALKADMSWQTANKHIKKLQKFGVVDIKKTIRKSNVSLTKAWASKERKDFFNE